ncbi:unnamed protein product [Phytophthora lilii]|uniref:Unnamed protein product n=1 Tax=Phytophthora lilii TaxID=2077276 RepID=A0A9W7CGD0_9STRA|nr:unnamed protein product [Phytophthora lilii]
MELCQVGENEDDSGNDVSSDDDESGVFGAGIFGASVDLRRFSKNTFGLPDNQMNDFTDVRRFNSNQKPRRPSYPSGPEALATRYARPFEVAAWHGNLPIMQLIRGERRLDDVKIARFGLGGTVEPLVDAAKTIDMSKALVSTSYYGQLEAVEYLLSRFTPTENAVGNAILAAAEVSFCNSQRILLQYRHTVNMPLGLTKEQEYQIGTAHPVEYFIDAAF